MSAVPRPTEPRPRSAGDLLEVEAWYFIDDFELGVDFDVTWRHPDGAYFARDLRITPVPGCRAQQRLFTVTRGSCRPSLGSE